MPERRRPFTDKDRDALAHFLLTFPEHKRRAMSTFREAELKLPGHTAQSWRDHYLKTGNEDVNRQIEKLKRERDRKWAAEKAANAQQADGGDNQPVASTSKAAGKGKAKETVPSHASEEEEDQLVSSSDDDSADEGHRSSSKKGKGQASTSPTHRKARVSFDDEVDWPRLVTTLAEARKGGWQKSRIYQLLEENYPEHTRQSWQTWHSNNRQEAEAAVAEYLSLRKKGKKNKDKGKRRDSKATATEDDHKKKEKRRESPSTASSAPSTSIASTSTAKPFSARPSSTAQKCQTSESSVARPPSSAAKSKPRTSESFVARSPTKLFELSQPASDASISQAARAHRQPSIDVEVEDAALHTSVAVSKGKGKAVDREPSPAAVENEAEFDGAAAAIEVETEGDSSQESWLPAHDDILVHQLARAEVKEWGKDSVWKFLGEKYPIHSSEEWRAHYRSQMGAMLPRVAEKVQEMERHQKRKADEREKVKKEREAQERAGKEKEKEKEKEEEEEEEEEERKREKVAMQRKEAEIKDRSAEQPPPPPAQPQSPASTAVPQAAPPLAAPPSVPTDASADFASPTTVIIESIAPPLGEADLPAKPSPSPARPTVFAAQEGSHPPPLRATETAPPAASALRTPLATPPPPHAQVLAPLPPGSATPSARRSAPPPSPQAASQVHDEVDEPSSSQPHFSQYSVLPSPMVQTVDLVAQEQGENDDDDEPKEEAPALQLPASSWGTTDSDRVMEQQLEASISPWAEVTGAAAALADEGDVEALLGAVEHVDSPMEVDKEVQEEVEEDDEFDRLPIWNDLLPEEVDFILEIHATNDDLKRLEEAERVKEEEEASQEVTTARIQTPAETDPCAPQPQPSPRPRDQPQYQSPPSCQPQPPISSQDSGPVVENVFRPAPARTPSPPRDANISGKKRRREASSSTAASDAPPRPLAKKQRLASATASPALAPTAAAAQPATTASAAPISARATAFPPFVASPAALALRPAAAPPPAPIPAPAPAAPSPRRPLKTELTELSTSLRLPFEKVRDLYYCCSAPGDMSVIFDVCLFFSPLCPDDEERKAQLERRVQRFMWSFTEDTIALEGTEEARARVEKDKGRNATAVRRKFLAKGGMFKVAQLRRTNYEMQ
ncbi:hypothetical protein JCM1841_000823 [Sporobolomyces salmonicolor]